MDSAEAMPAAQSPQPATGASRGLRYLLAFAGTRRGLAYLGCALSALSMLVGFGPYLCIWLVARDLIAVAPHWELAHNLPLYGWWALGLSIASLVIYLAALMCTHLCAFRTAANIRKACTAHLMDTSLGYFDTHASGALRRVIDGCAGATENLIAHKMPDVAGSLAMIAGLVALLLFFDWRLGLMCLLAALLSLACMFSMMGGKNAHFMEAYQQALVDMSKAGTEYVRGIPVVKVFQQTVHSFKAFHAAINAYSKMAEYYTINVCRIPQVTSLTLINGVVVFLACATLLFAPAALAAGRPTFAAFFANFAFYAIFSGIIATAMTRLMFVMEEIQISMDASQRIQSLLSAPLLSVKRDPAPFVGSSIEFDDVTFTYEGGALPALDHLSFQVPAGTTAALVGPSGGGKTTAASLVPRFWDADVGAVRLGGTDVRELEPHALMSQVAFVFQNNRLFKKSIYENVAAARPDITPKEVFEALEKAQCTDILDKLPQGAHTVIGADGVHLSGGELQRIALARAIAKDAPIVVLDEATAFADPENEALIQKAFGALARDRTVLMIAHRLSTVANAQKILVVSEGKVVEQGTHEELLAKKGLYARMWEDYQKASQWKIRG